MAAVVSISSIVGMPSAVLADARRYMLLADPSAQPPRIPCRRQTPGQAPPAAIMLRSLRKVFPSRDGNAQKVGCTCCLCWPPQARHGASAGSSRHLTCNAASMSSLIAHSPHPAPPPACLPTCPPGARWRWPTCPLPSHATSALACWAPTARARPPRFACWRAS